MREIRLLNDGWLFFHSEQPVSGTGESVTLPHTWSTNEDSRRGVCCYARELPKPELSGNERVWLEINGAAMTAEVCLNGKKLARHEGGYSTFRVDLTNALQDMNLLTISVDNRDNQTVYPQKADFTFYGGLYRDVKLMIIPAAHFALGHCGGPGIKVTPKVDLPARSAEVTVEAWVEGDAKEAVFETAGQRQSVAVTGGYAQSVFTLENVHLWDGVNDPFLYTVSAKLDSGMKSAPVSAAVSLRSIRRKDLS